MDNETEVCGNCEHLKMQHGFPMNSVCGAKDCDCEEFLASGTFRRY